MIQIDMEMPSYCIVCPLWNYEYGQCNFCGIKSRYYDDDGVIYDILEERYKECPLKEIKE